MRKARNRKDPFIGGRGESRGSEVARGQRVYGKSHPTRESIDLNLLAFSSRGRAPSPPLPGAPISRSGHAAVSRAENFRRTSARVPKSCDDGVSSESGNGEGREAKVPVESSPG